jgi:L-ascorbate metabolism protein UlaG (beta-lactamase superfamily)
MLAWVLRIALGVVILIGVLLAAVVIDEKTDHVTLVKRSRNENLETIKPNFTGNAIDQRDRFFDEQNPYLPSMLSVVKWKLGGNPLKDEKETDSWRPEVRDPREFLASGSDGIMWLGHASFYIRLNGVGILADPVFGDPTFLRRMMPVESQLDLIDKVDYVLLSHDHRDHMDGDSIKAIAAKFPRAVFIAGLRSEDILKGWTTPTNPVITAGWFQRVDSGSEDIKIYFLPARHWSRRSLLDTNWRLWGSYIIQSAGETIYFGGDSGYSEHFREVGELFPKIDHFIVGIGAYEPRWIMEPNHQNPEEAVRSFMDAKAGVLIPMHYGTFDLTDEPPSWPLKQLTAAADAGGVADRIHPLAINQGLIIGD